MDALLIPAKHPRFATWLTKPMLANKSTYIKVAAAAAMISIFGLVSSLFTMTVYDRVVPNNATDSLIALSIGLGIVIIFDFIMKTLRAYFVDIAGAEIDEDIGRSVFQHLIKIRLDKKKGSTGALAGLIRELETLRDFFASATIAAIVDVPFVLLTLAVIALIGGKIALVPAVMIPIIILVGLLTQPALDRLSRKSMGEGLLKQTVLVETIGGLETIKTSNAASLLGNRWLASITRHSEFALRQRLVATLNVNTATSAQMISYAGVVIVGVGMIQDQTLSMGGLIACSILSGRAVAPLAQIASLLSRITMTRTAYQQINELMETPTEGPEKNALRLKSVKGKIEFRNVDFRYPGANEPALKNLNFVINQNDHIAILGQVGSGKSTIIKLILGLFPPEAGLVMIDGTDIRQIDPTVVRQSIGTALQECVLVSGSVRENIALERPSVDDEELVRAATISGTHQFMGQIANGYDLRLADRGEGLSGGQRQSIALARAIAGKPPLFLLDEPTSAMDAQTEAGVIDRLEAEFKDRTIVLVTHRPSMLRLVERVILMDSGKIIADGPREEILAKMAGKGTNSRNTHSDQKPRTETMPTARTTRTDVVSSIKVNDK
jgi:ATP-binding cassette subfamily C protein LapB